MSKKDFHEKGFEDSTLMKLEIIKSYLQEWLRIVFKIRENNRFSFHINIYDFFAGPGTDGKGNPGTPLIIIDEIQKSNFKKYINSINIIFNDINKKNIVKLKENINQKMFQNECCNIQYYHKDFQDLFQDSFPILQQKNTFNLLIMDPFGIRNVTPDIINCISNCFYTDFLLFLPSSYIYRFKNQPEFKKYFGNNKKDFIIPYQQIHRKVCEYFKSKLPHEKEYFLAPFSIKKATNIYGIIFGSGNILGLNKFLEVSWVKNNITGDANFNIDNDFGINDLDNELLFPKEKTYKKKDKFKNDLINFIKTKETDNCSIYKYTLQAGFLPKHANEILKNLENEHKINVKSINRKKSGFYINYNHYKKSDIKIKIKWKEN